MLWVVEIGLISMWGINLDLIIVQDAIEMVVWVVENDFISMRWTGIDLVFLLR